MSERGVFAVDRGVWDHPIFADEPFTEREAWLWMVSAAAWVAKRVRVGRAMIELRRGQLAFATRFMAQRWKWAHSRVVRFIKRLETDTMVSTLATREATLITICNYDKYAFGRNTNETQNGTQISTPPERPRNKEEELKKDKKEEVSKEDGADAPLDPSIAEREFFARGREVLGKGAGGLIAKLLKAKGGNIALARAAIEHASQKDKPAEYIGAACRGPPLAKPLTEFQRRRNETVEILNELDSYVTRSSSGEENPGVLPGDPSERPQGLHSGIGSTVIDLPALGYRTRN